MNPLETILSLNCYIDLQCSRYADHSQAQGLEQTVTHYLADEHGRVFLLMGKSGSGKSLFLFRHYLRMSSQRGESAGLKCVYTKLNKFSSSADKELFRQHVQEQISGLREKTRLILYLDGFDEFGEGREEILALMGLADSPRILGQVKIFVTCRTDTVTEEQLKKIFYLSQEQQHAELGYICPVSSGELEKYLESFVRAVCAYNETKLFGKFKSFKTKEEYQQMILQNRALADLATEPFTIRLLVGIMPDLKEALSSDGQSVTMMGLLELFVNRWIENELLRLSKEEQGQVAEVVADIDANELEKEIPGVVDSINQIAVSIALHLWVQGNKVSSNVFTVNDLVAASKSQGIDLMALALAVKCLPVTCSHGGQYSFIHKSIADYFLARLWKQDLESYRDLRSMSHFSLNRQTIARAELASLRLLTEHALSGPALDDRRPPDSALTGNKGTLAATVTGACLEVINMSRSDSFKDICASSNALTILNYMGFSFAGMNLSRIKARGSLLDSAMLDEADLSCAQLENCLLARASMVQSNLQNASLSGCDFGIPYPDFVGHGGYVTSLALDASAQVLASGSWDNSVKIWDLQKGQASKTLVGHAQQVSAVAITPDLKHVVSGSWDRTIKIWSLDTGTELRTLAAHSSQVNSLCISQSGQFVVSASTDQTIRVWSLETGAEIRCLTGHAGGVRCVVIAHSARQIISAGEDGKILVWDWETGARVRMLAAHAGSAEAVAASADASLLVSGGQDRLLKIWSREKGSELKSWSAHSDTIRAVAFSSDQRYVVSGSSDKTIKIWNADTAAEVRTLSGHTRSVSCLLITPDMRFVLSGSQDKLIKVWNFDVEAEAHAHAGHSDSVSALAVSEDGTLFASGGGDRAVKVWQTETGRERASLAGHQGAITCLAVLSSSK